MDSHHHLLAEDDRLRPHCYHLDGTFLALPAEACEQSLLPRFAQIVALFPDHVVVEEGAHTLTTRQLDAATNRVALVPRHPQMRLAAIPDDAQLPLILMTARRGGGSGDPSCKPRCKPTCQQGSSSKYNHDS